MAHEWGFAAGDGNDEGAFAWFPNAEDLEGEEEEALARQLADFEGAVHGEIHLHNKKAPHGKGSSLRNSRVSSDRQTVRPLKVQVEEWRSAFLHMRVRGEAQPGVDGHEPGWQAVPSTVPPRAEEEAPPHSGNDNDEASKPQPQWSVGSTAMVFRVADKIAAMRANTNTGLRDRREAPASSKPLPRVAHEPLKRVPADSGAGGKGRPAAGTGKQSPSLRKLNSGVAGLRVQGCRASIIPPSTRVAGGEAVEEVFAVDGEMEEVFAQHTENWISHDDDIFSNSRRVRTARRVGRAQRAQQESQREEERKRAALRRAGVPPKEPRAAALAEAHGALFDTLWASLCPLVAPLLASLVASEPEAEGNEAGTAEEPPREAPASSPSPPAYESPPPPLPAEKLVEPAPVPLTALMTSGPEPLARRRPSQDSIVARLERRLSGVSAVAVSRPPSLTSPPRAVPGSPADAEKPKPAVAAVNMNFPGGFGGGGGIAAGAARRQHDKPLMPAAASPRAAMPMNTDAAGTGTFKPRNGPVSNGSAPCHEADSLLRRPALTRTELPRALARQAPPNKLAMSDSHLIGSPARSAMRKAPSPAGRHFNSNNSSARELRLASPLAPSPRSRSLTEGMPSRSGLGSPVRQPGSGPATPTGRAGHPPERVLPRAALPRKGISNRSGTPTLLPQITK
mmetsp:Transcript_28751/g.73810  ORF Transcript_28751/g.73810 Transcript_28751/m.73810 type:complete len:679 (-) Transcript_28751:85-2121(-)